MPRNRLRDGHHHLLMASLAWGPDVAEIPHERL